MAAMAATAVEPTPDEREEATGKTNEFKAVG
jgi:hypothetical protein